MKEVVANWSFYSLVSCCLAQRKELYIDQREEGDLLYRHISSKAPADQKDYLRGGWALAVGALLRQEELVFIKSMSNFELSPVFLRELKNAVAAGKRCPLRPPRKMLRALRPLSIRTYSGVTSNNTRISVARIGQKESWTVFQVRLPVWARKPLSCARASFGDVSAAKGSTSELVTKGSRQIESAESGLA